MKAVRSLWPFIHPYRAQLAVGASLAALEVIVQLAQPWPLKWIVDELMSPQPSGRAAIARSCVALAAIVATTALLNYWSTRILSSTGLRLANSIREATFGHLNRLSLRFHGQNRVGDLAARVTGDVDRAQDMIVQGLAVLAPNAMLLVGMSSVMLVLDPTFALLALALTPLLGVVVFRAGRALKSAEARARKAGGEVASATTETLGAMSLVQAYTLEAEQAARFGAVARSSLMAGLDAVRHQARFSPAVDLTAAMSTIAVLWFGAERVRAGALTVGELLVFVTYVGSIYKPLKSLAKLGRVTSKGAVSTDRLRNLLDEEPQIVDHPHAVYNHRLRGEIRLVDVSFDYGREAVLRHVDVSIGAGEKVALVGPTGAGKTTIVSLIPRLIDATEGVVEIDGYDVRDLTLRSLRQQVCVVLQDCSLLHATLRENIALGRPWVSTAQIERAARLALVDEFSCRLPHGLDTQLGERGANLSSGQRQRVAIARAILRDAPILILDEPTSALDTESEELIIEALSNLPANRTTIVIAHRLSTVRLADRVLVIDGGRVVEDGPPDRLVAAGGLFQRLSDAGNRSVPRQCAR